MLSYKVNLPVSLTLGPDIGTSSREAQLEGHKPLFDVGYTKLFSTHSGLPFHRESCYFNLSGLGQTTEGIRQGNVFSSQDTISGALGVGEWKGRSTTGRDLLKPELLILFYFYKIHIT